MLGGAAFGGAPLLYGMDSNNPRADFEKDFPNTLRTSAITGGVGTILGAGTGALLNSAALARRKKKIRRKVTDSCLESLPKTAAARDYITRGTHFNSSDSLQKRSKIKIPFLWKIS